MKPQGFLGGQTFSTASLRLLGGYGLRNKRELWQHRTMLSKFRSMARSLLSMSTSDRAELESQLLGRLKNLGILPESVCFGQCLGLRYGIDTGTSTSDACSEKRTSQIHVSSPSTNNAWAHSLRRPKSFFSKFPRAQQKRKQYFLRIKKPSEQSRASNQAGNRT